MIDGIKLKNECVQWIRDWFAANGKNCNAVVGISGGKDSTVVAGLLAEALGPGRVIGVLMPNGFQSDLNDAIKVCEHLNIKGTIVNIECINDDFLNIISGLEIISSEQTKINLPPRIRMSMLYAISQSVNGRVANTCNLSEDYVGYSTRWGDAVGDFAPLGGLLTDEVVAIGDALGLPHDLVHKTPSDGLCGKTDEDNLGFTYDQLNTYIRTGSSGDEKIDEVIKDKHDKNLFKLQPIPVFHRISLDMAIKSEPLEPQYDYHQFLDKYCLTCGSLQCSGPLSYAFEGCKRRGHLKNQEEYINKSIRK
jgi:NAD+ synthase